MYFSRFKVNIIIRINWRCTRSKFLIRASLIRVGMVQTLYTLIFLRRRLFSCKKNKESKKKEWFMREGREKIRGGRLFFCLIPTFEPLLSPWSNDQIYTRRNWYESCVFDSPGIVNLFYFRKSSCKTAAVAIY